MSKTDSAEPVVSAAVRRAIAILCIRPNKDFDGKKFIHLLEGAYREKLKLLQNTKDDR